MDDAYCLLHGDCRERLQSLHDNSIDAIVTDPPYGLAFMGKKWDYDVPSADIWRECLRVLKPGGHLLAFAGTRTQHRMACNIEDAGFDIRDMIAWVYGSGFPKSLDVGKAIDKVNGEVGRLYRFTEWMRSTGLTARQIDEATGTNMGGHYLTAKSQPAIPTRHLWAKLRPLCGNVPAWVDELVERIEAEREIIGQHRATAAGQNMRHGIGGGDEPLPPGQITAPATDAARQWDGWGTALKPAMEPITVARKPLCGTVAENVMRHGTGGINVDACRIPSDDGYEKAWDRPISTNIGSGRNGNYISDGSQHVIDISGNKPTGGRWPANLIHDGSDEVVGLFPNSKSSGGQASLGAFRNGDIYGKGRDEREVRDPGYGDSGSAARFFYCAKASKRDRDEGCDGLPQRSAAETVERVEGSAGLESPRAGAGRTSGARNHHPTVKPTDLMRYLCRLVTPPGGTVLDPFMGSGSTGKAAMLEGFRFIGIEREAEYVEIAKARIESTHGRNEPKPT